MNILKLSLWVYMVIISFILIFIGIFIYVKYGFPALKDKPQVKLRASPSIRDDGPTQDGKWIIIQEEYNSSEYTRLRQMKIEALESEYIKWAGEKTNL